MATKSLTLFNHKGGVGKTTLTINLAAGFADLGERVMIVDADPQCNVSAFFLEEAELDRLLGETEESESGATIWSAIKPVVDGRGDVVAVPHRDLKNNLILVPGDVLLSRYEEELPSAWIDSFARKSRGYDVMCAMSAAVDAIARNAQATLVMYDVGPNVGPLNRAILLGSDYFVTPVAPDLFSLRALTSVGGAMERWIRDWQTIRSLASTSEARRILHGQPTYLGYIVSAFKAYGGGKTMPHEHWERRIAPRVKARVVDVLAEIDPDLVGPSSHKLGEVKHFQSLTSIAQDYGVPLSWLQGSANPGYNPEISTARENFQRIARQIRSRMDRA